MKDKRIFIGIMLISISLFISACTPSNPSQKPEENPSSDGDIKLEEELKQKDEKIVELQNVIDELEEREEGVELDKNEELLITLSRALKALKEEDMEKLKGYVHPEKGLRFSAYPHVDLEKDIVLKSDEIEEAFRDTKTYTWGNYDGRGDPIELSFKDYYKEFVYDEDFLNAPIIGNNTIVSEGNTIDNVEEAYPDSKYAEMYFEGFNKEYAGADWKSLKLVFEEYEGKWYLVGAIHGQWTI